jgi:hypothetical protein
MRKISKILFVLPIFVITNTMFSQTTIQNTDNDSLVKEKLAFIENAFQEMQSNSKVWKYGWYATFSALAISQGTIALTTDNKDLQKGMALGTATSFTGIGGLVTNPLQSIKALKILQRMPANSVEERRIKLEMAEKLVKKSSEREINGKHWKSHATAGAINLAAGMITWLGFEKSIWEGLQTFAISTAIAELQILTQPRKSIKAYKEYQSRFDANAKFSYRKKQQINWFVSASPIGFRLNVSF